MKMTKAEQEDRQRWLHQIEFEWFADHKVTISKCDCDCDITRVRWGREGTSHYAMVFALMGQMLYIAGDLGEATYRFSSRIEDFETFGDFSLDYFDEKRVTIPRYGATRGARSQKPQIRELAYWVATRMIAKALKAKREEAVEA